MKSGDKLYQLQDDASPYSSANTLLVCALLTLGARLDETQPFQEFHEIVGDKPKRSVMWLLKETTTDGAPVKILVNQWRDPKWLAANPGSPIALIKAALENYRTLVHAIKSAQPVDIVRRGRRMVLIPKNATGERRNQLLEMLEK
jgi:hypothetical protein